MKTLQGWRESKVDSVTRYLQSGDEVDGAMYDYFLNILPPAYWRGGIMQVGEPYSHREGKPTYMTFTYDGSRYWYHGCCHRGKTTEPGGEKC